MRDSLLFVDFEASSLASESYPVELGWANGGASGFVLIRPEPDWTDWSASAAELHGLSREHLLAEGKPAKEVADLLLRLAAGRQLVSDAPDRETQWMGRLLALTDHPPHLWPTIIDLVDACWDETARLLSAAPPPGVSVGQERLHCLWAGRRARRQRTGPRHRAEPDAQGMLLGYQATAQAVTETLERWAGSESHEQ
jgi:hypothetical protein